MAVDFLEILVVFGCLWNASWFRSVLYLSLLLCVVVSADGEWMDNDLLLLMMIVLVWSFRCRLLSRTVQMIMSFLFIRWDDVS